MMAGFWRRAKARGSAGRGALFILSANVAGQLLMLAATPLIANLYGPSAYGAGVYVMSVGAIVAPLATLRLESAIPLPVHERLAGAILWLGTIAAIGTSLATAAAVFGMSLDERSLLYGATEWAPYAVGFFVLSSAMFALLSQAALRMRQYGAVATRTLVKSGVAVGGQLALVSLAPGGAGVVLGQASGRLAGAAVMLGQARPLMARPARGALTEALREYWRFPLVFTPSTLLNGLGTQLPVLVVGAVFGASETGSLGLAISIAVAPTALVGAAIQQVFNAELAARARRGQFGVSRYYLRLSGLLAVLGIVWVGLLAFVVPVIVLTLLGDDWALSVEFFRVIAISAGASLVAVPLASVYSVFQRARASLLVDMTRPLLLLLGGGVGWLSGGDVVGTVLGMYIGQFLNYTLTWSVGWRIARHQDGSGG